MNVASAPGKIILFGEHSVVYGRPALAVPVTQVQATAEVWPSDFRGIWIDAPNIRIKTELRELPPDNPLGAGVRSIFAGLGIEPPTALNIRISSTIPVAAGLGSGAAVSVALIRALSAYMGQPASDEEVSRIAFETEKLYHGNPSGIDNSVITHAKPVYFVRGKPIETFKPRQPFTVVIGDTGVQAPTRESVTDVHRLWELNPRYWEELFTQAGEIANAARRAIEFGKIKELGELMDRNHALLQRMTVSSADLDRLVEAARRAGSLGAKLSGGGRGGNMIALVDPMATGRLVTSIEACLLEAGAKRVITTQVK